MKLSGWGMKKSYNCKIYYPKNIHEIKKVISNSSQIICRGMGRSYGNSSIQPKGTISTIHLNKIIKFNKRKAEITVESGVILNDLLKKILPHNLFIPVSPGTKFVTIGGMVASDVHGKNDHISGSFGNFIKYIKLINSSNKEIKCDLKNNRKIFFCTIGGMGSTGVITEICFSLKKIKGDYIKEKKIFTKGLNDLVSNLINLSKKNEYSVAWLDLANNLKNFNSIIFLGNHAKERKKTFFPKSIKINFFNIFSVFLNNFNIKIFNRIILAINLFKKEKLINLFSYFYPLDKIKNWNYIYSRKGLIQFQFVCQFHKSIDCIHEILKYMNKNDMVSYLSVMKTMSGKKKSLIGFGKRGISLALDFPFNNNLPKHLLNLKKIVIKNKGRVYLTKENFLNQRDFKEMYQNYKKFFSIINKSKYKKFRSIQTMRLFNQ